MDCLFLYTRLLSCCTLITTLLVMPVFAEPDDSGVGKQYSQAEQLLNRVIVANRYYSYEGLLTYEANGSLSTMHLQHYVDDSGDHNRVLQRLEFLDGADRHVVRNQPLKSCSDGQTRWGLWPAHFDIEDLKRHYHISIQGRERIAGRQSWVLDFVPKDDFRYGYRLNVDVVTGLLLRSLVVENNEIVERTQFVALTLRSSLDSDQVDPQASSWRVPEVDPCHTEQFQSAWYVDWLPDGFQPAGNRITAQGEQVLMFTDGLVSISVFITSGRYQDVPKITARRGATVAVISPLSFDASSSVAVVGEIPAVTARRIAVSVKSQ